MAKNMELMIEIGSKLNGKFGAIFSSAQKQVSAMDKKIKELNTKKETFTRYESLKKEMAGTLKSIDAQQRKLKGLKQQLDKTSDPAQQKKLKQEITKTEKSISKMNKELQKQKTELSGVKKEIQNGGGYKQYREEIQRTEEQLRRLEQQQQRTQRLRDLQNRLNSKGEALKQSGFNNIKTGMVAGAAVALPVKLALDDEEAFAGVKKVANMEFPELMNLKGELQGLTKQIPITTNGMYEIAEASLQAGIGAKLMGEAKIKEVSNFTQLVAKSATAMDIAESQAGEWLATWKQNLNLNNEGVQELADRMNHLSDMNNAKAEDIANIFSKIMGTGKVAGFTTQEMIALSTSIKAAGVDAEQAGTHLDIMMSRLGKGDRASKQTREALQSIGLDAQKVANDMQKPGQASAVFLDVLEKIQKLPAGERLGVANHIFGGDAGKTAAKLVANTDILKGNLKEMEKYEWQGSIGREFENRSATGMNNLRLAFNSLKLAGIQAGETLAPSLTKMVMALIPVIDKVSAFISKNPEMVKSIGLAVAGFAGFNLALGAGKIAFGNILIGASKLIGLFIKFGGIPGIIAKIGPLVAKIGPALGALTGPVGWVVMAIVGLIAAFVLLYKKSVWFRNGVNQALGQIKPHVMELAKLLKGYLGKAFEKLRQYGTQAMPHIRNAFNQMKPVIKIIGKLIVSGIINQIRIWINVIKAVVAVLKFIWPVLKLIGKFIMAMFVIPFKIVVGAVKGVILIFKTLWNIIKTHLQLTKQNFLNLKTAIIGVWNGIKSAAVSVWNRIKSVAVSAWNGIKTTALNTWSVIKAGLKVLFTPLALVIKGAIIWIKYFASVFKYLWNGAKEIFKALWELMVVIVQKALEKIKSKLQPVIDFFMRAWNNIKLGAQVIFNTIAVFVMDFVKKVITRFNEVKTRVIAVWNSIKLRIQMVFNNIKMIISNFIQSSITKFNSIKEKVLSVVANVKTTFVSGFNYIATVVSGPINTVKAKIGEIISKVLEVLGRVKTMFSEAWNTAKTYVDTAIEGIKTKIQEIISKLQEVVEKVKEAFNPANWSVVANITAKINEVKNKIEGNYTGNSNFKGGLTWLAERGRELVQYPSGEMMMAASKAVHYLPKGSRIFNNSNTERMLSEEEHQAFNKLQGQSLSGYVDGNLNSSKSSNVNKSTVSSSNGGVSIVIHNNYYGNQTTAQIKETNNDLVRKINKVLFDNDDRDRRVSLG